MHRCTPTHASQICRYTHIPCAHTHTNSHTCHHLNPCLLFHGHFSSISHLPSTRGANMHTSHIVCGPVMSWCLFALSLFARLLRLPLPSTRQIQHDKQLTQLFTTVDGDSSQLCSSAEYGVMCAMPADLQRRGWPWPCRFKGIIPSLSEVVLLAHPCDDDTNIRILFLLRGALIQCPMLTFNCDSQNAVQIKVRRWEVPAAEKDT